MNKKDYKSRIQDLKNMVSNHNYQQRNPAGVAAAQAQLNTHKQIKQASQAGVIKKAQKKEQRAAIFDAPDPLYNGAQRSNKLY